MTEQNGVGRSLKTLSVEHKSSPSPGLRNWARKARLAWLSEDLLVKLRGKKQMHRQSKQVQDPGKSTGILHGCVGVGSGKPRSWNFAKDTETNTKGCHRYVSWKGNVKESVSYKSKDCISMVPGVWETFSQCHGNTWIF